MIFETHAHYDDSAFDEDRDNILNELKHEGIKMVVNAAASIQSTKNTLELTETYEWMYGSVGVHPSETLELDEKKFQWLSEVLRSRKYNKDNINSMNKIVAVGEIGLDYYWKEPETGIQKYWFEKQLKLAIEEDIPVIIHSRDAAADTLKIIKEAYTFAKTVNKKLTGVIHCFSYSSDIASEYVKMGFFIGISGVITFKNAKKLAEVVSNIPIERIVVETDSPYLSPEPNRGKRNNSKNLHYVVRKIAEIKEISEKETEDITFQNALNLYRF